MISADYHTETQVVALEDKVIESVTLIYDKATIRFKDGSSTTIETCKCCGLSLDLDPSA